MTIKIKHKRSAVAGKAPLPADLEYGEIAVNYEKTDPALYIKDSDNIIRKIGGDATETDKGIVELATAAETTTGTDATRAVHPAGLKVELDKKVDLAGDTMTGPLVAPSPLMLQEESTKVVRFGKVGTGAHLRIDDNNHVVLYTDSGKSFYITDSNIVQTTALGIMYAGGGIQANHENPGAYISLRADTASAPRLNFSYAGSNWVTLTNACDARLKEPLPDQTGLGLLSSLKPRRFTYKKHRSLVLDEGEHWGFYAQELIRQLPSAAQLVPEPPMGDGADKEASGDSAKMLLGEDYYELSKNAAIQLCSVLTKALQETVVKIETLEARITTLEGGTH